MFGTGLGYVQMRTYYAGWWACLSLPLLVTVEKHLI